MIRKYIVRIIRMNLIPVQFYFERFSKIILSQHFVDMFELIVKKNSAVFEGEKIRRYIFLAFKLLNFNIKLYNRWGWGGLLRPS